MSTSMRLENFAEFEGTARLDAHDGPLLMRLPPRAMPPTRLTCGERIGPTHRGNAKLFYERRHEASGQLELALAQLATCGLHVTNRHPICRYRFVVNAKRAAAREAALERGVPFDPNDLESVTTAFLVAAGFVVERQPVFYGDRVILQYEKMASQEKDGRQFSAHEKTPAARPGAVSATNSSAE